jgi:hypothetical protein
MEREVRPWGSIITTSFRRLNSCQASAEGESPRFHRRLVCVGQEWFGPVTEPVNPGIFRHDLGATTADRAFCP